MLGRFTGGLKARRAITLFEMVIVLAVTMILSMIFIYSSKHILIRTKMERVKEEHRVLQRALANYRMDYNDYPSRLSALNAPTAYLSSLPSDPFNNLKRGEIYTYYHQPSPGYRFIIVSTGPDGRNDLEEMVDRYMQMASGSSGSGSDDPPWTRRDIIALILPTYMATRIYDPTNGAVSAGDVISFTHE